MASYVLSKLSKSKNARDLKFKTMVLPLFHSSVVLYFVWLDYHALTAVYTLLCRHRVILQSLYVLGLQYFTLWGQFLQQLYFVSCVLKDVLLYTPDKKLPRTKRCLEYLRGVLFPSVVFPISVVMSINFWCFYNIDPTLWEDLGAFRDVIPLWLNHGMHTNIVVLCILEVALNPQLRYPDRKTGLLVPATIILLYATTCVIFLVWTKQWQYPVFRQMSTHHRLLLVSWSVLVGCTAYILGETIHYRIWGKPKKID